MRNESYQVFRFYFLKVVVKNLWVGREDVLSSFGRLCTIWNIPKVMLLSFIPIQRLVSLLGIALCFKTDCKSYKTSNLMLLLTLSTAVVSEEGIEL